MLSIRARLSIYAGLAFAGLVLVLLVTRRPPAPLDNPAYAAIVRAHSRRMAADAASLDTARTALVKKEGETLKSLTRYVKVRDSVFVPVTHAETVAVLDKLPSFLAATDSLHRSCAALADDCETFRVRAESSLAGLTVDRDLWKGIAESQRPSRWEPVRQWAIRVGVFYLGVKAGQGLR